MDFSGIPLFNIMKVKLEYLSQRQAIFAQNIANADTPNYKAKDLAAPDFKKLMSSNSASQATLRPAVTKANHIATSGTPEGNFAVIKQATTDELKPNGNNVTVEGEMAKVAQNQADYQQALNLYSKAITMFKTAIGNPSTGA